MLTSAITAAITVLLTWLGIPPGPYVAGIWIAVKILIVALVALLGWRAARRRSRAAPPPTRNGA
jgi:chromate transport protein ChrA